MGAVDRAPRRELLQSRDGQDPDLHRSTVDDPRNDPTKPLTDSCIVFNDGQEIQITVAIGVPSRDAPQEALPRGPLVRSATDE
jgi:hypothetical protein